MHGRKRAEYKHRFEDPQVAAGLAQKAQQWYALSDKALQLRSSSADDDANKELTLPLLDKMLRVNPDPLHLWNIRRDMLVNVVMTTDDKEDWLTTELSLTAAGLERNPKAYGAWFHRKWVLQQKQQQQKTTVMDMEFILQQELALTDLFLQRDERNFHCWNFRRFLVGLELQVQSSSDATDGSWRMVESWNQDNVLVIGPQITSSSMKESIGTPETATKTSTTATNQSAIHTILQREWDFTQSKIVQNFSNFSAFHYRSKLLLLATFDHHNSIDSVGTAWSPDIASNDQDSVHAMALQEWSLMENIMFTEPDDQTIWWYHRFVLDWVLQHKRHTYKWYQPWLKQQAETLQVLVEELDESNNEGGGGSGKWGLLGWHLVLSRLTSVAVEAGDDGDDNSGEWKEQMESILDKLIQVDPDRTERYKMMKKQQLKA